MGRSKVRDRHPIPGCCPAKLSLVARPLLRGEALLQLERTFKVLANGTRLRLLHALVRQPGIRVSDLASKIGMKPQAVSNQLQRLIDRGILGSKRNGTSIHYTVVDSCVVGLLDQGLCLTEDALKRR